MRACTQNLACRPIHRYLDQIPRLPTQAHLQQTLYRALFRLLIFTCLISVPLINHQSIYEISRFSQILDYQPIFWRLNHLIFSLFSLSSHFENQRRLNHYSFLLHHLCLVFQQCLRRRHLPSRHRPHLRHRSTSPCQRQSRSLLYQRHRIPSRL